MPRPSGEPDPRISSGLIPSPRGTPVFISRGIGWAIYPVRFDCLPEIAVLELVSAWARRVMSET